MISICHAGGKITGTIVLPYSKSISNRLLIINAISGNNVPVKNLSASEDTEYLSRILSHRNHEIYCGDGGTTFRFLLAFLALKGKEHLLTGSTQLNKRPVKELVAALTNLGAEITYCEKEFFPPLLIKSKKLNGGKIKIDATTSSQFISALMMIAPALPGGLEITLAGKVISRPYISMTKKMMQFFGADVYFNGHQIVIPEKKYEQNKFEIEKDWSSASYIYEIAALADDCDIFLPGLSPESIQGDAAILEIMEDFGVTSLVEPDGIRLIKSLKGKQTFIGDFSDAPDLIPALSMCCAAKNINATFKGIETLVFKESNRIEAIQSILTSMKVRNQYINGALTQEKSNKLILDQIFETFHDHRIAMCVAPLSLKTGRIVVNEEEVVAKSFPDFWNQLMALGFEIQLL
jgi:3-phosphoshikimate 1-carboxyvinyltransferase